MRERSDAPNARCDCDTDIDVDANPNVDVVPCSDESVIRVRGTEGLMLSALGSSPQLRDDSSGESCHSTNEVSGVVASVVTTFTARGRGSFAGSYDAGLAVARTTDWRKHHLLVQRYLLTSSFRHRVFLQYATRPISISLPQQVYGAIERLSRSLYDLHNCRVV